MFLINNVKKIFKQTKNEYKYLSPNINKIKNKFYLFYCNRGHKSSFYGEINLAYSNNLKNWKKKRIKLKPSGKKYISFVSPYLKQEKNFFYLYIEGQKKNHISDILRFRCNKNLSKFYFDENFKFSKKKTSLSSPFFFNNHFFYSMQNFETSKIYLKYKKNNKCIIKQTEKCEKFNIYAPCVIKIKKLFILFYSAWESKKKSVINISYSKDFKNWYKTNYKILSTDKNVSQISEVSIQPYKDLHYIFFEYKDNRTNKWNISNIKLNLKNKFNNFL